MSEPVRPHPRLPWPVTAVLLVIAFGGGYLLATCTAHDTVCGDFTILDAERILRSEGTDFMFTAPAPGQVEVLVALSANCSSEATVRIGPLRTALRPDVVYEPELEPEHTLRVRAQAEPRVLTLAEPGPYAVRLDPVPMAMGNDGAPSTVRVIVRLLR